jgi:outer membrane protein TolC
MFRPAITWALFAACGGLAPAQPEPAVPLLTEVARAPAAEAARRRIDSARVRVEASGRLADPEVEAMGSRINADAMGENRDMWEVSLRQPLPRRGERAADRERAAAGVTMAEADFAMTVADLAADVAMALAEADGADEKARLLEQQIGRLAAALQSLDTRLASGLPARVADRLTVQSRLASLQLAVAEVRRTAENARAEARSRIGLDPAKALPAFSAPAVIDIRPAETSSVALASARVAEANAMGRMARASANPMTAVGLRFERERSSMGNQDTVGLAVSSEIPWRTRRYARAESRAAELARTAAQSDADAARHRTTGVISRVERAERVAATARRLAADTQARLDAEHDSLNRAISAGAAAGMGGDSAVLHAIDILDKSTELQMQIIEAEIAVRVARAELWRHVPAVRILRLAH